MPVEQRQIEFYGDEIVTVLVEVKGQLKIYVPIRAICEHLGLNWAGQLQRLRRDEILGKALSVCVIHTDRLGTREAICLPIELLPGWLFGIDANRVKLELRPKMIIYKGECFNRLWEAYQADALPLVDLKPIQADETIKILEQVRQNALAVVRLTEEQIALTNQVAAQGLRLDRASLIVRDIRTRLEVVEKRTAPPVFIRDDQAAQIFNQVKALAEFLTSKDNSKDHYGAVFGAIYRQFDISSYHRVRQGQFEAVMKFLADWHKAAETGHLEAPHQLRMFDPPTVPEQGSK